MKPHKMLQNIKNIKKKILFFHGTCSKLSKQGIKYSKEKGGLL